MSALDAWEHGYGFSSKRIVIHDTGVDIAHPDLQPNMLAGWDFDHDDADANNPAEPHGTACAGLAAAARNALGVVGVVPGCRIIPLRAAGAHPVSTWAETFDWAARRGDVISCSWTIGKSNAITAAIRDAVADARGGLGVPVCCAVGNGGVKVIGYPANLPETIGVGASTNQDLHADYSNTGEGLDLVAPSSGGTLSLRTTDVHGDDGVPGDYRWFGGTSGATPQVAAAAALLLSVNPTLSSGEVKKILRQTADKIDPTNANYGVNGWSEMYGHGRLNAAAAVAEAVVTAPLILRTGDSGESAGYVSEIVASRSGDQQVVTAVRTSTLKLKLISWGVEWNGAVTRQHDSGSQAGSASDIDIARASKIVTACRTGGGTLRLISWDVMPDGVITRIGDSGGQGEAGSVIKIVALTPDLLVTAHRTSNGSMRLISWRLGADGSFSRLHDSGNAAGAVEEISLVRLPGALRVVSSVRTQSGRLKLIVWGVAPGGEITREGDSEQAAGGAQKIASAVYEDGLVITAVQTDSDRLKLISWRVSDDGSLSRLRDSGDLAGTFSATR